MEVLSTCIKAIENAEVGKQYRTLEANDENRVYVGGVGYPKETYHKHFVNKPLDEWVDFKDKVYELAVSEDKKNHKLAEELWNAWDARGLGHDPSPFKAFFAWAWMHKCVVESEIIVNGKVTKKAIKEMKKDGRISIQFSEYYEVGLHGETVYGEGRRKLFVYPETWRNYKEREQFLYEALNSIAKGGFDLIYCGQLNLAFEQEKMYRRRPLPSMYVNWFPKNYK